MWFLFYSQNKHINNKNGIQIHNIKLYEMHNKYIKYKQHDDISEFKQTLI